MRRRALLTAAGALTAAPLAGCLATTSAEYDLVVRDWQDWEHRAFTVHPDTGDTIRVEFQQTQSDGASIDIYRPDLMDGIRVFDVGLRSGGRSPTSPVEYTVDEGGQHQVVVHPCCQPGGGTSRAWVRIYVE